jgi:hypothetical protein
VKDMEIKPRVISPSLIYSPLLLRSMHEKILYKKKTAGFPPFPFAMAAHPHAHPSLSLLSTETNHQRHGNPVSRATPTST